jgi:Holliday junction resolvase
VTQPETRIQRSIQRWLKEQGVFVFKVHGSEFMPAGLPDLVCCIRGRFVCVEVKTPTGTTSKRQAYMHRVIEEAGGVVIVATCVADVRTHAALQGP